MFSIESIVFLHFCYNKGSLFCNRKEVVQMRNRGPSFWKVVGAFFIFLFIIGFYFVMADGLIYLVIILFVGVVPPALTMVINRWLINKLDLDDDVGIKPRFGIIEVGVLSIITALSACKLLAVKWVNIAYLFLVMFTLFFCITLLSKYRRDTLDDHQSWMEMVLLQNIIGLAVLKLISLITIMFLPRVNVLSQWLIMKLTAWLASGEDGQNIHVNSIVDPNTIIRHCHQLPQHWLIVMAIMVNAGFVLYALNQDLIDELDFDGFSLFNYSSNDDNPFAVDDSPTSGFGTGLSFGNNMSMSNGLQNTRSINSHDDLARSDISDRDGHSGPLLQLQKSKYQDDDIDDFVDNIPDNNNIPDDKADIYDNSAERSDDETNKSETTDSASNLVKKPTVKGVGHLVKQGAYWYGTVKSLKKPQSAISDLKTEDTPADQVKYQREKPQSSNEIPLYDQAHVWVHTDKSNLNKKGNKNGHIPVAIRRARLKQVMNMFDIQSFNEHAGLKGRGKGIRVGLLKKYDFRCQVCGRSPRDSRTNVVLHVDFKNLDMAKKYQHLNKVAPWKIPLDALTVVCSRHTPKYFAAQKYLFKHYRKEFKQTQRDMARQRNLRQYIADKFGYRCAYCGNTKYDIDSEGNPVKLQLDHIVPVANGGLTRVDNLQWLCRDCNLSKSDLNLRKADCKK